MLFIMKPWFICFYKISMTVLLKETTENKRGYKKFLQTDILLESFHTAKLNWIFQFLKILIITQIVNIPFSQKLNNLHSRLLSEEHEATSNVKISIFLLCVDVFVKRMAFANLFNPVNIFDTMSQVASLPNLFSIYTNTHKTMSNF